MVKTVVAVALQAVMVAHEVVVMVVTLEDTVPLTLFTSVDRSTVCTQDATVELAVQEEDEDEEVLVEESLVELVEL